MDIERRCLLFREPANRKPILSGGSTVWKAWKDQQQQAGEKNWPNYDNSNNECPKQQQSEYSSQETHSRIFLSSYCQTGGGAESTWGSSLPALEHEDNISTGNTQKPSGESWREGSHGGQFNCQEVELHCSESACAQNAWQPGFPDAPEATAVPECACHSGKSPQLADMEESARLYYQQMWWWTMYCAAACRALTFPRFGHSPSPVTVFSTEVPASTDMIGSPLPNGTDAKVNYQAVQGTAESVSKAQLELESLLCEESGEGLLFETQQTRKRGGGGGGDEATSSRFEHSQQKKMRRTACGAGAEVRVCSNCGTGNTPFWRKDKHGGQPLCNACGLYSAKNDAHRPKALWKLEMISSQGLAGGWQ